MMMAPYAHPLHMKVDKLSCACRRHFGGMSERHDKVAKFGPVGADMPTSFLANLALPAHFYVGKWRHVIDTQEYYTIIIYPQ
jgi:hypothetical protein